MQKIHITGAGTPTPTRFGTLDAAKLARDAGAKTLILTHQGSNLCRPGSREKAIADISKIFSGGIIFSEELMTIDL